MSTEWMGRYRNLVAALVQHSNINTHLDSQKQEIIPGLILAVQDLQVLEYVIEHKNEDDRMMLISERLGIPQSSFSKIITRLYNLGLVQKYQMVGNKKNIIIKPTEYAEDVYQQYTVDSTASNMFRPFFEKLDSIDDDTICQFTDAINSLTNSLRDNQEKMKDL